MEEKKVQYILDVNMILEMIDLKKGKVENSYLNMCQYLSTHSSYTIEDGKSLPGMPNINVGALAIDNASGDVVTIKDAYCNARYLELKNAVCARMEWPKYVTLDLEWILEQFRQEEKWKKENELT